MCTFAVHVACRLIGSDHRRHVRPKFRQQASTTHLKILRNREGVTTDLPAEDPSKLDPNDYSTYMGEHFNLEIHSFVTVIIYLMPTVMRMIVQECLTVVRYLY